MRIQINLNIEKKHFFGFLIVLGLILGTSVTYAVVSHNADQIFFTDGSTLQERFAELTAPETDPTVLASVKDGVAWSEISSIPAGFADGVDNVGIASETDPTVPAAIKDGIVWSEVGSKPTFASDIINNRAKMVNIGCGGSWGSSCDAGQNGWPDYADTAPWAGISGRPPISSYGSGVQATVYYDDNTNYYLDANSISYLNDIRMNIIYDRQDTNFYVDPNGNSKFAGYLQASHLSDVNDPNYYVDPNGGSRFWGDVRIDSGWLYAPKFADINNPSMRYVDPTDHTQIGSLTTYGNIYAFSGLSVNRPMIIRSPVGTATWEMELFVWENSGCNYEGNSLGCHSGRCLCIKRLA
jgi:hypothetical protein